jgi:hypothetical protein
MDRIRFDLRELNRINVEQMGRRLDSVPLGRRLPTSEQSVIRSAVAGARSLSPAGGCFDEPFRVAERRPRVDVIPPASLPEPGRVRRVVTMSPVRDVTLAVGGTIQAMAVVGVTAAAGIYGSTTSEVGLFGSVGGGWWTNVGAGAGIVVTVILGPPSDFAGVSWGVGCDARFMAGSIGGLLLFSPPPFRFLGVSVSLTVGPSAIPAFDVTVQVSTTGLVRLI